MCIGPKDSANHAARFNARYGTSRRGHLGEEVGSSGRELGLMAAKKKKMSAKDERMIESNRASSDDIAGWIFDNTLSERGDGYGWMAPDEVDHEIASHLFRFPPA